MKRALFFINTGCYLIILLYAVFVAGSAVSSGYPWAITCYNCGLCRQSCPVGLDPYGFIAAATANDLGAMMQAVNVKLLPHEAALLDKNMPLVDSAGRKVDPDKLTPEQMRDEVFVTRMQARHAAAFCILCGNCERICPIRLPIMTIIKGYRNV
jgi:ferredoxin